MYQGYNWRLLRHLQGDNKKDVIPYTDTVMIDGKSHQRIYISDEFFCGWDEFKQLADYAKAAHFLTDSYTGGYTRRSDALPLTTEPKYLVERLPVGHWVCWINATISEPDEFQKTLFEAQQKRDEVKKAYSRYRDAAFPMLNINTVQYSSEENQPTDDYVNVENILSVFGINQ